MSVEAIVDTRDHPGEGLISTAAELGIEVLTSHAVTATGGSLRVSSMSVRPLGGTATRAIRVDALLTSAGWTPSVHMFSQSRGKVAWDEASRRFLPGVHAQDCVSVGACNGTDDLQAIIDESLAAGEAAAKAARGTNGASKATPIRGRTKGSRAGGMTGSAEGAGPDATVKAFVDFQNDVTAKDIRLAVREGMHSIEHVKRFTTTGMATDQGKTSNIHGLAIAAEALDRPVPKVGLTTFRAPYTPVTFGAIVGHGRHRLFDPARKTPMHGWEEAHGAVFEDVGPWKRAWYYPRAGEDMHAAVDRECVTVRRAAGVFDATTLGKIEVVGPDAAKFLDLIYTNGWQKMPPGRCKYGVMLREDGFIYDDGVVGRLAEDRFHVTTTTGGAPRVLHHMEDYLQTEFPELDVWLTSTSEQWATIAVQGPKAREIVEPLVEDIDMSAGAMPHMSVREGRICGVPTRLFRMSFTGEPGFEINVPSDYGLSVWEAVWARAEPLGACAYGTETMHVLQGGKGLHHRRPGDGRDGDAARCGAVLGDREVEAGFRRHPRAEASRPRRRRPEAARRPEDQGPESGHGGGRADRFGPEPAGADDHDRARDLVLLVGELRPIHRARPRRQRPQADGRDALRADARPHHRGRGDRHGVLRRERGEARWLNRQERRERMCGMRRGAARLTAGGADRPG